MAHWEAPGETDEWYTPPEVFEALGVQFYIDVAPARYGVSHVPSARMLAGDGLVEPWRGFAWCNPPFGGRNGLAPWLEKFIAHGNGIMLVPDRTSAPWFQAAFPRVDAVLFTRKLHFIRPDGTRGVQPSTGTALLAIGWLGISALQRAQFSGFGIMAAPWKELA